MNTPDSAAPGGPRGAAAYLAPLLRKVLRLLHAVKTSAQCHASFAGTAESVDTRGRPCGREANEGGAVAPRLLREYFSEMNALARVFIAAMKSRTAMRGARRQGPVAGNVAA